MNNYGIIIQCRDNSIRFPDKSIRPFWEGKSILEVIYEKLIVLNQFLIVVATTYNSPKTIAICKKLGIPHYIGPENNVAKRLYLTCKKYGFDGFFRVCADSPFTSLPLMYPVVAWVSPKVDYVAFKDCMRRHEGFFVEYIKTSALRLSLIVSAKREDLEHVTPFIIRNPDLFRQKILPIPPDLNKIAIRLTVDTASDFYIAKKVYKYMKNNYWGLILDYIRDNPDIQKQMIKNRMENKK